MIEIPRIISVDDHVVEPSSLWLDRLPRHFKAQAPRVERRFGFVEWTADMRLNFVEDRDAPEGRWGDVWVYDNLQWPLSAATEGCRTPIHHPIVLRARLGPPRS